MGVTTHPALRRRKMIDALTRGRIGVYSKLYAMRICKLSIHLLVHVSISPRIYLVVFGVVWFEVVLVNIPDMDSDVPDDDI